MIDRILDAAWEEVAPFVRPMWESVVFWRIATLVLLLLVAVAITKRERIRNWLYRPERRTHDQKIYEASAAILSEENLRYLFDDLLTDRSYLTSRSEPVDRFERYFESEGSRFLDKRLNDAVTEFVAAAAHLRDFMGRHFFVYPRDQRGEKDRRLCLHPEGDTDREGSAGTSAEVAYDRYRNELRQLVGDARAKFLSYRIAVKARLVV